MSSLESRHQIIAAAGPQFAERGYGQTTVRQICDAAGVNLAAVNYYFRDKAGLYAEVLRRAHQDVTTLVPTPTSSNDESAEERLRQFVQTLLSRIMVSSEVTWQTQLMLREVMDPSSGGEQLVDEFIRPQSEILHQIISQLVPPGTSRTTQRRIEFSVIGQCMHYRVAGPVVRILMRDVDSAQELTLEKLTDHITNFTLSALGRGDYFDDATDVSTAQLPTPHSSHSSLKP